MLIGGGFLDGFGKNPLPRVQIQNSYSPQIPSPTEQSFKPHHHALNPRGDDGVNHRDRSRRGSVNAVAFGRDQTARDQEVVDRQQRYKEELDRQMAERERKRNAEKCKEREEEMRLELKVKRDRELLAKQQLKEGGIFGVDADRAKLDRARKQELFQEELRRQSEAKKRAGYSGSTPTERSWTERGNRSCFRKSSGDRARPKRGRDIRGPRRQSEAGQSEETGAVSGRAP